MANPRVEELPQEDPKKAQVEEVDSDSESESEAEGEAEAGTEPQAIPSASTTTVIQSRNEKKARKLLEKLHLTRVQGITRVTLRRPKNVSVLLSSLADFHKGVYVLYGQYGR